MSGVGLKLRQRITFIERHYTRQALILRVLGHDFHHGGEISTTLGMHGVPGVEE